jgi:hypothetical protein
MFRSKKKNVGGRKRREVEVEEERAADGASAEVGASSTAEAPVENEAENELQRLEELRRSSRSRTQKGLMTFSSKSSTNSRGNDHSTVAAVHVEAAGLLSFDDEGAKKEKKRKMRPNLVAATAADVVMEVDGAGSYSAEMLASLRNEQSALPGEKAEMDVEMENVLEVEAGNDQEVEQVVQEEEEEFISLEGGTQTRRAKNRVTFGLHAGGPGISKSAEVVEHMSGEDEDDEQHRRWEEELMRRGGHRVPPSTESQGTGSRSRDGLPTYPTRKKVASASLGAVLGKLEKSLESTSFEDDRASRELARLEAETALIETALKEQQEELLVSSEEFEFFQEIEDFVKGLSFCLREKVPAIEAKEKSFVERRVQQVDSKRQEERLGLTEEVKLFLVSGKLQQTDIVGLTQLDLLPNGNAPAHDVQYDARLRRYQQHFTESYVAEPHHVVEDFFADAIDEINSLERVYGRFQEWKAKFPDVYKNSYCELAQEKLFAPYVQAELIYWDPLAVADSETTLGKTWSLGDLAWFRVLHQHRSQAGDDAVDGPLLYQIRDVLLEKVRVAVSSYFDPYSSLQARSLSLILEEINRRGYFPQVEGTVQALVTTALENFSGEAKRTVLIAIDQHSAASSVDVNVFARYLLERFNALQDNLLTLFVALPKGVIAAAGFRCLLQVLHHLLAYARHCQETHKMHLVGTATQVVRQLSGSSYLLQILSEPSQERELKHMMEMFSPFLQSGTQ